MAARTSSRDLYDAWRLLLADGLDREQVKLATLAIGAATRDLDWRTASLDGYRYDIKQPKARLATDENEDPAPIARSSGHTRTVRNPLVLRVCRAKVAQGLRVGYHHES
jgi:hypothetical protein